MNNWNVAIDPERILFTQRLSEWVAITTVPQGVRVGVTFYLEIKFTFDNR